MKKHTATVSLLLAGLIAAAGAVHAQSTPAAGSSDVPSRAGEASTMTQGVPNANTTNSATTDTGATTGNNMGASGAAGASTGMSSTTPASKDLIRAEAKNQGGASATSSVPSRAGDASTMVNGRPNANPDDPMVNKSRAERRAEREMKRADNRSRRETAIMGQKGAQAGAPAGTPAVSPAGTPSVHKGGTPK